MSSRIIPPPTTTPASLPPSGAAGGILAGTYPNPTGNPAELGAAETAMLGFGITGDTNARIQFSSDGDIDWGGGSGAADVSLGRIGAGQLAMAAAVTGESLLRVQNTHVGTGSYASMTVSADGASGDAQLAVLSSGYTPSGLLVAGQPILEFDGAFASLVFNSAAADMIFATGGVATANEMLRIKGDNSLVTAKVPVVASSGAAQVEIGNVGPSSASGITFQNGEVGSNLYRSAAGALKSDGALSTVGNITTNGFLIAGAGGGVLTPNISDRIGTAPFISIPSGGTSLTIDGRTSGNTIQIGVTAGTKIGLYAATPVAQATTAGTASTFAANTSLIANDTATWDGYTIGQVVKALRNIGALA